MKKLVSLIFLTALCSMLAGCGVKGGLYFPAQEPSQTQQK